MLADLNDEDLEVAQAFHHAPMRVKQRALGVLQERGQRGRKDALVHDVGEWAKRLLSLAPQQRQAVATVIAELELLTHSSDDAAPTAPPTRAKRA